MPTPGKSFCNGEAEEFPDSEFSDTPRGRVHNTLIPHFQLTGLPVESPEQPGSLPEMDAARDAGWGDLPAPSGRPGGGDG